MSASEVMVDRVMALPVATSDPGTPTNAPRRVRRDTFTACLAVAIVSGFTESHPAESTVLSTFATLLNPLSQSLNSTTTDGSGWAKLRMTSLSLEVPELTERPTTSLCELILAITPALSVASETVTTIVANPFICFRKIDIWQPSTFGLKANAVPLDSVFQP